jgi:hypothetical protein
MRGLDGTAPRVPRGAEANPSIPKRAFGIRHIPGRAVPLCFEEDCSG